MTLPRRLTLSGLLFLAPVFASALSGTTPGVQEIVKRSVAANEADWKAAPAYAFTERDVESKRNGAKVTKTYQVVLLNGSPYSRLVALNDRSLTPAQNAEEEKKLLQEVQKRRHETPAQRDKRITKYQRERHQDHQMMSEMAAAFTYKLLGEGNMDGHQVYILDANPNPGYTPHSRDTKVLTGMRGRMWIDKATYQWVRVEAEVVTPVEFGMFIARVGPGTKFLLEQEPVGDGSVWLPRHFEMNVNASVLGFFSENSTDNETYTHYEPNRTVLASLIK